MPTRRGDEARPATLPLDPADKPTFLEFFAGGGMARAGLGPDWECVFANEIDPCKAETYKANWGSNERVVCDIGLLTEEGIPTADLAWASFPCQDLSVAGKQQGLAGLRSGAFWNFMALMRGMRELDCAPRVIVLENVPGLLTSNGGSDINLVQKALTSAGYHVGMLELDAAFFVPQSRNRLFIIASDQPISTQLLDAPMWLTPERFFEPRRHS